MLALIFAAALSQATPPATHTVQLTEDQLGLIQFLIQSAGTRCGPSDEALQYCNATLLGRKLIDSINAQVKTPTPSVQPPSKETPK